MYQRRLNHYELLNVLMDESLPIRCFGVLLDWLRKRFVCVRWGSAYSSWFQISAGVRQGEYYLQYCFHYIWIY